MRRALLFAALFLALAAPLRAQDEPPVVAVSDAAADAYAKAAPILDEAQKAFAAKDWDRSIKLYTDAIAALGGSDATGGWRDQALYNIACAQARAGRPREAAETFAKSVVNGLRPVAVPALGGWRALPGLTLEHVLVDADLDSIRTEPAYLAALRPYLLAGEPKIEVVGDLSHGKVPAVIVLAPEGVEAERALPAWRVAARGRDVMLVALAGPVRPTATDRRWLCGDGDDRWAAAKVKETLDLLAKDERVDAARVCLVGVGERPGEAAWAAAMGDAKRLAGFAAPGARFHAEWHADAIAALGTATRVALAPTDAKAAQMLKEHGIDAKTIAPSKDESATAAAILDAMLRAP